MENWPRMVRAFYEARGQYERLFVDSDIDVDVKLLRVRLMQEELAELTVALQENRPEHAVADAICDLLYVVVGTADACGMGPILDELFSEVHRSNMTKDNGEAAVGEKYGPFGKGLGYEPPRLGEIIERYNRRQSGLK